MVLALVSVHVRHASCSGDLSRCWQWDPIRRLVVVVFDGEAADIPVATQATPRIGSWVISRLNAESWRIAPSRFEKHRAAWATYAAPYEGGIPAEFVELTNAPDDVAREMSEALR